VSKPDPIESAKELLSGRFQLRRRLGEGGFGVVYAAYDRERGCDVAIKVLTRVDASALYRFKQEFRSLQGVRHPNLVGLQELFSEGELWFFTMELVSGIGFSDWVRKRDPAVLNESTNDLRDAATVKLLLDFDDMPEVEAQPIVDEGRLDVARLRQALPQLVEGIAALHDAGKLHCDLKPSNVLVTPEGRVVILDFGLVREAEIGRDEATGEGVTAGTPSYMSPEHARGEALGTASDWYSMGVMLFEALTGHLPFVGSVVLVLTHKMMHEAPAPSELVPGLPTDLESLCVDLLRMDVGARPQQSEIKVRSNARPSEGEAIRVLVGRENEIAALRAAFARAAAGGTERVLVHGPAGAGKSTLVKAFLAGTPDAVVLASRCYEQESVPYKGIDAAIDALARRVAGLPEAEQQRVLGDDGVTLAQIFPVLRTVEAVRRASPPEQPPQRVDACASLKHVLGRLAERAPIVLFIDDAQWTDPDSAFVLDEILRADAPRRLLVVATSHTLDALAGAQEIALAMLSERACRDLARAILGDDPRIDRIAKESRGDPLLVESLCRDVRERGDIDPGDATLEAATLRRLARLDAEARRLFELIACAGTPIESGLLARAAGDGARPEVQLAELCARRWVRVRSARAATFVEAAHDRLRDIVVSRLPSYARRVHHAALAEMLETTRGPSDELLAVHWQIAGDDTRAAELFARAAVAAERVLAFERAARLYRQALGIAPRSRAADLYARLADVLVRLGRGRDARQAFLSAAALLRGDEAAALERRAASLAA
jgi:hypothetical protein